jgi:ribose transport system substrate-binding protein
MQFNLQHPRKAAGLAVLLSGVLALSVSAVPLAGASSKKSTNVKATIAALPAALSSQYVNATSGVVVSPYQNFKKVKGPWEVCYSDSYEGNAWRVAVKNELQRLSTQYQKAGLVKGFKVAVSNNNVVQQAQQIRQFTSEGCSVILTIVGSSTGLNQAINAAKAKGIPVVTISGSVSTPNAINVGSNYYVMGYDIAQSLSKVSKNVLMVEGIAGNPIAQQENSGGLAEFAKAGTTVVAQVNGDWTPSVTMTAVLTTLTTNTTPIGAVWSTGSESAEIDQAFQQSSRPAPVVSASISGDAVGFWKANPTYFKFVGVALMPTWAAQTGFNVAMRTLAGKGPRLSTVMVPIPNVTQADLPSLYGSCMTPSATSIFPVTKVNPLSGSLMNAYFDTAGNVGPFQYSQTPNPCAK